MLVIIIVVCVIMLQVKFRGKSTMSQNMEMDDISETTMKYKRFDCKKWGVVTTIYEPPSEAVRRFLYRKDWCLVVVGDRGKPKQVS